MGGGSGGGGTTTQIQKSDPWAGQQPYLTDVFQQAQQQYYGSTPSYYPGQTVAAVDPSTQYAQNFASQQAGPGGALPAISNAAGQAAVFNLTDAKDVNSNPYLQSAIEAAIRPSVQAFTDPGGTLSQARTQFNNSGQFGSSRHQLAEGVLSGRLADNIFGTANQMASAGYTSGLNASLQQQALLPQTQQGILSPSTTAEAVGQQREAYAQQLIDAAINEWNFNQNLPAQKLAQYQNLIQGNYGGEGITTSTGPSASKNRAMGALGGAASGAAIGSAVPGIGTALGAVIGGIIGAVG